MKKAMLILSALVLCSCTTINKAGVKASSSYLKDKICSSPDKVLVELKDVIPKGVKVDCAE